jgi:hypothetical protein
MVTAKTSQKETRSSLSVAKGGEKYRKSRDSGKEKKLTLTRMESNQSCGTLEVTAISSLATWVTVDEDRDSSNHSAPDVGCY